MNYFGENERETQRRFALFRTRVSMPLLVWLDKRGCTSTEITLLSALCGLLFGLSVIFSLKVAIAFFLLHLLADSLDGSLARFQKSESEHGAFFDIITDHIALVTICAVPFAGDGRNPWVFPVYGFSYVLMITLITYGNSMGLKLHLVIRTKYIFFIMAAVHMLTPIGQAWFVATQVFIACNALVITATVVVMFRGYVRPRLFFFAMMALPVAVFAFLLAQKLGYIGQ
ncbi:MAG: hypothetical protein CMO80_03115 [Verrucomicrobiales bacterium]|nr:hypothetical protein [Verrucomicrobiales bacterium]